MNGCKVKQYQRGYYRGPDEAGCKPEDAGGWATPVRMGAHRIRDMIMMTGMSEAEPAGYIGHCGFVSSTGSLYGSYMIVSLYSGARMVREVHCSSLFSCRMVYYSFHQRATVQSRFPGNIITHQCFQFRSDAISENKAIIIHGKKVRKGSPVARHNALTSSLHDILGVLGEVGLLISVIPSATVTVGSTARYSACRML